MARRGRTAPVLVLLLALLATPAAASAPISAASDPSIPPEVEVSLMPKVHVCCRKLCRQSDLPLAFHVVRCSAHSLVPYPTANSVLTRSLPTCPSSLSSPFPCRPPLSSSSSSSSTTFDLLVPPNVFLSSCYNGDCGRRCCFLVCAESIDAPIAACIAISTALVALNVLSWSSGSSPLPRRR